jgi:hypothetical protein
MNAPSVEYFDQKAREIFSVLIDKYKYRLSEVTIKPFNVCHIYTNKEIKSKIEISNSTYGSDYGFSFFIFRLGTKEYNILYNVPHELQYKECQFLIHARNDLFSTKETINLIAGTTWKELNRVFFQKK